MRHCNLLNLLLTLVLCSFSAIVSGGNNPAETDYLAIMIQGQKVGHAVHHRLAGEKIVETSEEFTMTLGRGGQTVKVFSKETHRETLDGKPISFEMLVTTSGIEQKTTGTVKDGKVTITKTVMGQAQTMTVNWPAEALMFEGMRIFQEKRGLKTGDEFEVTMFRPDLMMPVKAKTMVGEKTKVDLFGRVLDLTEVKVVTTVQGQEIAMTSYIDDEMKAMKTLVPMMGMTMEMVACDKSFALRDDDIMDFMEQLYITSPIQLSNLNAVESIAYTIKPTAENELTIPNSCSQTAGAKDGLFSVTVTKLTPSEGAAFPYQGDDETVLKAMQPADYLQSEDKVIIDLAKSAVGGTTDAAIAIGQIEAFVDGYITEKDLSVGYASALEVARSRQGDCSEHAVLTAAMCRAIGIPARVVCGVVYADSFAGKENIFGGHMWVEAHIDGQWIGLDATRAKQGGFGPGHITLAFGNGDPADFFSLVNTLGCFEIQKIDVIMKP
ncbi:MAG: transglutaminase-like domain-containing protein [Planctomycetota bacterium]|jgi:hypothetical protein